MTPDALTLTQPIRLVQVGASPGETLTLTAAGLRASGVELYGSTRGLTAQFMADAYQQVVDWARAGELVVSIERAPLSQIEAAWARTDLAGKRLVIVD